MNQNIELLQHQYDALTGKDPFQALIGGIGSGKSFTGAHFSIAMAINSPHSNGFIGANTYRQLHDATLGTLFSELNKYRIPYKYLPSKGLLWIWKKMFFCRSLENFESLRGIEISDFWIDETRDTKEEAMQVLLGRLRDKRSGGNFRGLMTTSPSGYNWLYNWLVASPKAGFNMVSAKSYDNHHLADGYLKILEDAYDDVMIKQELGGEFINLQSDQVYYSFKREINVQEFTSMDLPNWVGMDFNVNPMTAVVAQVTDDKIFVHDEFFLPNSNTYQMADRLINKYGYGLSVVPDGTGKALKTATASLSDHLILKEKGFDVVACTNPHRQDRFNCVNGLLQKAKIIVHPKCVNLIKDFEQASRDEKDKMRGHIGDALGYLAWNKFPIKRSNHIRQYNY